MMKDPLDFTIRELVALGYEVKHISHHSRFDDKVLVVSPLYRLIAKIRRLIKGEKQKMTIHERMVARSEREKDLLKYGRSQERERIIKLLKELWEITYAKGSSYPGSNAVLDAIALIKGEK